MKTCIYCGAENEDFAQVCDSCGTQLPDMEPPKKKKGLSDNAKKWTLIGVIAAVVIVAIVGAVIGITSRANAPVNTAFNSSAKDFVDLLEEKTNLTDVAEDYFDRLKSGKFSGQLQLDTDGVVASAEFDYSKLKKLLAGSAELSVANAGLALSFDYSADKDAFQMTFAKGSYNVYGFKFSDMEKAAGNSKLTDLLPIDISKISGSGLFQESTQTSAIAKAYKKLTQSMKVTKLDERELTIGGTAKECKVYQLKWDETTVDSLITAVGQTVGLPGIAEWIAQVLPKVEPECLCFVDKAGQLVGVDVVSLGKQYVFLLEGEDNLWDRFTLTETSLYGETVCYTGGLEKVGTVMTLSLKNGSDELLRMAYDEADGAFEVATRAKGVILSGNLVETKEQGTLCLVWYSLGQAPQQVQLTLTDLKQQPEELAKEYRDLLSMNLTDWQRLLLDLGVSIPLS